MVSDRAAATLQGRGYDRLWVRCRESLERSGRDLGRSIQLSDLNEIERRAVAGLIGRLPGSGVRIPLGDLDAKLIDAVDTGLVGWLEHIGGPLRDRPAERATRAAGLRQLRNLVEAHALWATDWAPAWLDGLDSDGLLSRMINEDASADLERALAVLEALPVDVAPASGRAPSSQPASRPPASGRLAEAKAVRRGHRPVSAVPLAVFAAMSTGDTKTLSQTRVASLVERALSLRAGCATPSTSLERRRLWAEFGVQLDDVSSTVLLLNVDARRDSMLGTVLADAKVHGEPVVVTLRQLRRWDVTITSPHVFVCENPAVVATAAGRLGTASAPIVCTGGVATDAFWQLGDAVARSGSTMNVHADFDAAGVNIAGSAIERYGAEPWRFSSLDYLAAVKTYGGLELPVAKGDVGQTPWDPPLSSAIASAGKVVFEELVINDLIEDLATTT